MLTCRGPFARTTAADTMAAILTDYSVALSPANYRPLVGRIVSRCWQKRARCAFNRLAIWPSAWRRWSKNTADGPFACVSFRVGPPSVVTLGCCCQSRRHPGDHVLPIANAAVSSNYYAYRLSVDLGADAALAPFNVRHPATPVRFLRTGRNAGVCRAGAKSGRHDPNAIRPTAR